MVYRWWNGGPAVAPGSEEDVRVFVKNDTASPWSGTVRLSVTEGPDDPNPALWRTVSSSAQRCEVRGEGERTVRSFRVVFPRAPGRYKVVAEVADPRGRRIHSVRDVHVGAR